MSTVSIDSTNSSVSPATDWHIVSGGGYSNVEVVNVGGAGSVSYKVSYTGTNDVTSLGADHWLLPAAVGASRAHDLDSSKTALYVSLQVSATNDVAVTAW